MHNIYLTFKSYLLKAPISGTIALFVLLLCSCSQSPQRHQSPTNDTTTQTDTARYQHISLIALISNPTPHHNRKVRVEGYFHSAFENICLYVNYDDFLYKLSKNALWVDPDSRKQFHDFKKYSDHYVLIEGRFNAAIKGHEGTNSGGITDIKRIQILSKRN